ncbi:HAMP domain-containing histidine kinase [Pseudoalteromonas luteoviolacea]|uniref:sensor histidine kinase n=1 Tax=Pseudoalteromonas luteoviolacea TaxID=43657 RepID=UPI001B36A2C0|nr:HAMP domain-containing sensor histidine kinase [Pseudoalteromonas luteoviolacea]MBQ4811552.1 HAMP domain-containing histidine kinase [Pseudoalteromonas luteoviolacea]
MLYKNRHSLSHAQKLKRLQVSVILFLLLLMVPLSSLLYFSYHQSHQNQLADYEQEAGNLARVINRKLFRKLSVSNQIAVDAFNYYQFIHNPITKQTHQLLSPLAQLTQEPQIHGLVGYFQLDSRGNFNSPVWPSPLSASDLQNTQIEPHNLELITRRDIATSVYQAVFQSQAVKAHIQNGLTHNENLFNIIFDVPEYLIFYRIVQLIDKPVMQGYVVEKGPYLHQQIAEILELRRFNTPMLVTLEEANQPNNDKYFFYSLVNGEPHIDRPAEVNSKYQTQLIYTAKLHWPYRNFTISLSSDAIPVSTNVIYSTVFNAALILAILFACYGFYRFSIKQLELGEERLNFISSVSHELKTPLTSIKMYSEMLKSGAIASEAHKDDYYAFIYSESERLARLIDNILQLSTFGRNPKVHSPEYTNLTVLQDIARSKTSSLITKHNFELNFESEVAHFDSIEACVEPDAFTQIVINVTDNAIKFFESAKIDDLNRRVIDFTFRKHPTLKGMIQIEIRDYGNGVSKQQAEKLFDLFYRGENELTRKSQGTGIGLALVQQLVLAHQGEVQVQNRHPGLAILVSFPMRMLKVP